MAQPLLGGIHALALIILSVISSAAQSQTNSIGAWQNKAGVFSGIRAYTDSAVGIGTTAPDGKVEIRWCPPPNLALPGFLVTRLNCLWNQTGTGFQGGFNDVISYDGIGTGGETDPNASNTTPTPITPAHTYLSQTPLHFPISSINNNLDPLIWARIQTPAPAPDASDDSRFIVFPDGRTGINVVNPRCALDVRGFGANIPVAIFGVNAQRTPVSPVGSSLPQRFTKHIEIVPHLAQGGYNTISKEKDLGIIFTDGLGVSGSNQSGALVIAPWREDGGNAGLRMDANGNTVLRGTLEVQGKVTCNGFLSKPKWWPDFVFDNNYQLMSLDSLRQHISQYKHLPGIPSQKTVTSDGIDLVEMQQMQMQKIEELTLYVLHLKKEIEELREQLIIKN